MESWVLRGEVTNILWMIFLSITVLSWNKRKNFGPRAFSSSPEWKGRTIELDHFHLQNGFKRQTSHICCSVLDSRSGGYRSISQKLAPPTSSEKDSRKKKDLVLTPSASLGCLLPEKVGDILRAKYQHLDEPAARIKGLLFKMCTIWVLNTGLRDGSVVKNIAHSF